MAPPLPAPPPLLQFFILSLAADSNFYSLSLVGYIVSDLYVLCRRRLWHRKGTIMSAFSHEFKLSQPHVFSPACNKIIHCGLLTLAYFRMRFFWVALQDFHIGVLLYKRYFCWPCRIWEDALPRCVRTGTPGSEVRPSRGSYTGTVLYNTPFNHITASVSFGVAWDRVFKSCDY